MSQQDQSTDRVVLVAVNDIFFYTKVRDALRESGYRLERVRAREDVAAKASPAAAAFVVNLNEERLDPFQAIQDLRTGAPATPVLAFANHEDVETWRRAKALGVTKIVSRNEFSARTRALIEEIISDQLSAVSPGKHAEG